MSDYPVYCRAMLRRASEVFPEGEALTFYVRPDILPYLPSASYGLKFEGVVVAMLTGAEAQRFSIILAGHQHSKRLALEGEFIKEVLYGPDMDAVRRRMAESVRRYTEEILIKGFRPDETT